MAWANNVVTSEEIKKLADKWMYGTPPSGVRKETLITLVKKAKYRKEESKVEKVYNDLEDIGNAGVNMIAESPKYSGLYSLGQRVLNLLGIGTHSIPRFKLS